MKTILLIGTFDTKLDELAFMQQCLEGQGARVITMDVGVLSKSRINTDVSNEDVAAAADSTIQEIAALGDENDAMAKMAAGASALAVKLRSESRLDGMIALGGSMGTDLALDVAGVLPAGVPKFVVSTIAFSHLLPPDRIPADVMMILWSGGLYGLNSLCKAALSQACGAVVGAAHAVVMPHTNRPMVAMTSLGKSCLSYMVNLKPALEDRGFEVAVFHSTGMGGRAYADLASKKKFALCLDLCLQEVSNALGGSVVTAGQGRLRAAGDAGIPQIVAPGAVDMVDFEAWKSLPAKFEGRPYHAHNRLIASVTTSGEDRRALARHVAKELATAKAPVTFILPNKGIQQWDKEGEPLHDPDGLSAFLDEARKVVRPPVKLTEISAHINDQAFVDAVLRQVDEWLASGVVKV